MQNQIHNKACNVLLMCGAFLSGYEFHLITKLTTSTVVTTKYLHAFIVNHGCGGQLPGSE